MVVLCAYLVVSYLLWPHGLQPTRILGPWGFSRQEYWSMLPCSPPGDLPDPGIEPRSSALQADSLPTDPLGDWNTHLFKGEKQVANRYTKRCSIPLFIKEMQIITSTIRYQLQYLTPGRVAIIKKKSTNNKCWEKCREKGTLLQWECKLVQSLWKTGLTVSQEKN